MIVHSMTTQPSAQEPVKISVKSEPSKTHSQADIIEAINQQLAAFFETRLQRAYLLSPRYSELFEVMQKLVMAGGKRNRPFLTVLLYEAYGGGHFDAICKVGAATELLHTAMLIHDDIIDRDLMRHGVDNVAGTYLARYQQLKANAAENAHHAASMALLGGDQLLASAYELIGESSFSHVQRQAAQLRLSEAVFRTIGGEMVETSALYYPLEETNALKVSEYKTAYYSFILPLTLGAELAGAPGEDIPLLEHFGAATGVAFQLADDLLGTFGKVEKTGKSNQGDIREGRLNYLYQQAYQAASGAQRHILDKYVGNPDVTAAQADRVRQVYLETGARKATEAAMQNYAKKAAWAVNKLTVSHTTKNSLLRLLDQAVNRDH